MNSLRLLLVVGCLLLAPNITAAGDKPPPPGVTVRLVVEEHKDRGLVARCLLRNGSDKAVAVPVGYDGRHTMLYGSSPGGRWPLRLWKWAAQDPEQVLVQPGREATLYEIPLADVIFLTPADPRPDERPTWGWDWTARPAAPLTPFHTNRNASLRPQADFWAAVRIDGREVRSEPVQVRLRLAAG